MRKIIALLMAGIICTVFVGCGKTNKKSNESDIYSISQEKIIEHSYIGNVTKIDEVLYGIYYDYDDGISGSENICGLFSFDFKSKELTEKEIGKNVNIEKIYANSKGNIVLNGVQTLVKKNTESDLEKEESVLYNVEYEYDTDLNCLSKDDLIIASNSDYADKKHDKIISYIVSDDGKSVSLIENSDKYSIRIKDSNDIEEAVIELEDYAENLLLLQSGKVLCKSIVNGRTFIYEIDTDNGKLGKQIAGLADYVIIDWCAGKDNKILFSDNINLYECDCNTGKITNILKWIDCDINVENIKCIFYLSDGTLGILSDKNSGFAEIDYLYKQDKNAKKKAEITVGVLYLNNGLKEDILRYNETHNDTRIVVKEYYRDNEENYADARAKFHADIVSGNCPDIIDFGPANADINQYIEKGLIEDLTPYFLKDEEINIEDFVQSVVEAYKVNGKLYVLPEAFLISGFFGASSVVGDDSGWTLEEFIEVIKKFEKGTEICAFRTGENLLNLFCSHNMSKYIDWSKGECYFDTGEFADMLEFSYDYVKSDENNQNKDDDNSEITKLRDKQQILFDTQIETCDNYMFAKEVFGEDVTLKGYPSNEGNGVTIISKGDSSLIAISSKSKYKEEAWEIVRQRYLPKGENSTNYKLPIRQDDLDILLKKAMIPVKELDINGNEKVIYSEWAFEDVSVKIPYPTENDIEEIKKIIDSADTISNGNEKIMQIINEEAVAFYNGQKSADETAKIIQSRVSMYVKESY